MADRDDDTARTEDDLIVEELRSQGILGPFRVVDWAAASERGLVRSVNEDRWIGAADVGFVVADGMGGHRGGELAAEVATREAYAMLGNLSESSARELVDRANKAVNRAGAEHGFDRLGTTLSALVNRRTHTVVVSVGDSRVYRSRDGELEALTRDHSVRNELLAAGVALDDAAIANVRLDALTSFIGQRSEFTPAFHTASYSIMAGDRFLLCTDGVHGYVDVDAIRDALAATSCEEAVAQLVTAAFDTGGRDNVTLVVLEFGPDTEVRS